MPTGPNVLVLPGTDKRFDQFRADDGECRQYAQYQTAGSNSVDAGVRSAAVGTAVGALAGANAAGASGYATQQHYDFAYQ